MKNSIRIGLFGLGNVGQSVVELLHKNQKLLQQKTNLEIHVAKAVVQNDHKKRALPTQIPISTDPEFILGDPKIDVVIELIGGWDFSYQIMARTLTSGKAWITANKALLAVRSAEVWPWFEKYPKKIGFEAAVGGAMPIIHFLQEALAADSIQSVAAIINGTTNFILSEMASKGHSFEQVLKVAQQKGYAEADPKFDIEGIDSAHKIFILGQLAFHHRFDFEALHIEGISHLEGIDLKFAEQLGYTIKLLGLAKNLDAGFAINVYPALVPLSSSLAKVGGSFNAAQIRGDFLGEALVYGLGAGGHPTAVAIVSDILNIARSTHLSPNSTSALFLAATYHLPQAPLLKLAELEGEHYLRMRVKDEIGILAKIANVLNQHGLSIHQIIQTEAPNLSIEPEVDLVFLTHTAANKKIEASLRELSTQKMVPGKIHWFRIESNERTTKDSL